jgi:O-antigen/teichoic acid export membrane protein
VGAVSILGSRLSRHVAIYSGGSFAGLLLSLVGLAVMTRYLKPSEFGELAVYLIFGAGLTVLYNLGSLQASYALTFGVAAEEETELQVEEGTEVDKRRALGSAFVLTFLIAATGTAVMLPLAPMLADVLGGDATAVRLAATSGAMGAMWRIVANIPRLERKAAIYAALQLVRPIFVLTLSITLVASGYGVRGALSGTAIGSAAAVLLALVVTHDSWRLAFSRADAGFIMRYGRRLIPMIVGWWVIHNADVLLLSAHAPSHEVGAYRVASRVGAVTSYVVSAVLMAWNPLRRSSVFVAATEEHGARIGAFLALYFMIGAAWLLLMLSAGADLLIQIAPPGYRHAAPLIPLVAAGFVCYGLYIVTYRASRYPNRRRDYLTLPFPLMLLFVALSLVLIPKWGGYGAAAAVIIAPLIGAAILLWRSQRGPAPVPFEYRRMAGTLGLAGALAAAAHGVLTQVDGLGVLVAAVAVALYPVLAVLLRIVPREHLKILREIAGGVVPARGAAARMAERLAALPTAERAIVELTVRHGRSPEYIARGAGIDDLEVLRRLVRALRKVSGSQGGGSGYDAAVGAYLLEDLPVAAKDLRARDLERAGADPRDLDDLIVVMAALQSHRIWHRAGRVSGAGTGPDGDRDRAAAPPLAELPRAGHL